MAIGDLNLDGQLDIVVVDVHHGFVQILLAYNQDTFHAPIILNIGVTSTPTAVVLGYFNADGYLDIALTVSGYGFVEIWLGFGDGYFFTSTSYFMGPSSDPDSLAVRDLNEDNFPDLIVTLNGYNAIAVFFGNEYGWFEPPILSFIGSNSNLNSLVLADFNGDFHTDFAVANTWNHSITVAFGIGNGSFGEQKILSTGVRSFPLSIAVGDVNYDHITDIVVANSESDSIAIFYGIGDGTFEMNIILSAYFASPIGIQIADINGDNHQDILVLNHWNSILFVLLGNGTKSFGSQSACFKLSFTFPVAFAVEDMNRDGLKDMIIGDEIVLFLVQNQASYWVV